MRDIIFNGKSLNALGFSIMDYPTRNVAKRDINFTSGTAIDGEIASDNKRYFPVEETYNINSIPYKVACESVDELIDELIDWLCPKDGEYKNFIDTLNSGYFSKAICTDISEIKTSYLNKHLTLSVTFKRQPWWYSFKGQNKIIVSGDIFIPETIIFNPEKYSSAPLIRAYGADYTALIINDKKYSFAFSPNLGYVDLDTPNQSVYAGKVSYNNKANFDYLPILKPGKNVIKTENITNGSCTRLEIIPNWRKL